MNRANVMLSPKEMELLCNAEWILTKNDIMRKAKSLLEEVQEEQLQLLKVSDLPGNIRAIPPKISRGENYQGLPWLMLDHPRLFEKENVFAIRTFFWWGNYFSVTLQLAGAYKNQFGEGIIASYQPLKEKEVYLCMQDDPWQHHFEENNYKPVKSLNKEEFSTIIQEKDFIKLSLKIPLSLWDEAPRLLACHFRNYLEMLK